MMGIVMVEQCYCRCRDFYRQGNRSQKSSSWFPLSFRKWDHSRHLQSRKNRIINCSFNHPFNYLPAFIFLFFNSLLNKGLLNFNPLLFLLIYEFPLIFVSEPEFRPL